MNTFLIFWLLLAAVCTHGLPLWMEIQRNPVSNVLDKSIILNSTQVLSSEFNELCQNGGQSFVQEPSEVHWADKSKTAFVLTFPLNLDSPRKMRVETEAIYNSNPYLYWDKMYFVESSLVMTLPTPFRVEDSAPLWCVFKLTVDHCTSADIYVRLLIFQE